MKKVENYWNRTCLTEWEERETAVWARTLWDKNTRNTMQPSSWNEERQRGSCPGVKPEPAPVTLKSLSWYFLPLCWTGFCVLKKKRCFPTNLNSKCWGRTFNGLSRIIIMAGKWNTVISLASIMFPPYTLRCRVCAGQPPQGCNTGQAIPQGKMIRLRIYNQSLLWKSTSIVLPSALSTLQLHQTLSHYFAHLIAVSLRHHPELWSLKLKFREIGMCPYLVYLVRIEGEFEFICDSKVHAFWVGEWQLLC